MAVSDLSRPETDCDMLFEPIDLGMSIPKPIKDYRGNSIEPLTNGRIVSLVPSLTELLFDLGLGAHVVGRTKFCIHPADQVQTAKRVGGTKKFQIDQIMALSPDLIVCNKEENYREGVELLSEHHRVLVTEIYTLDDALRVNAELGYLTKTENRALAINQEIINGFSQIPVHPEKPKVAYVIWDDPLMVVGKQTFIDDMIKAAGFLNAFDNQERYPVITHQNLAEAAPDRIFLSSEPFPFGDNHVKQFAALVPSAQIELVDGELFSWYGSRLTKSAAYFRTL